MKFVARHLNLIGLLLLATFGTAAAGLYFQTPKCAPSADAKAAATVGAAANAPHKDGCCEKPVATEPPPAAACPHLAAQTPQTKPADSCCPKPANP